jgi:cell division protein ZapA (FtsZ GTPase activity inhibitor)
MIEELIQRARELISACEEREEANPTGLAAVVVGLMVVDELNRIQLRITTIIELVRQGGRDRR